MAPGGHRQWPISINALLDRFSTLILKTRLLALEHLAVAVNQSPDWCPIYIRKDKTIAVAPSPPIWGLPLLFQRSPSTGREPEMINHSSEIETQRPFI